MDNSSLPKYTSHKEVLADKIVEIDLHNYWKLESGVVIPYETVRELSKRKAPEVGDYYVKYPDGYESWCPAKAFEEGYIKNA